MITVAFQDLTPSNTHKFDGRGGKLADVDVSADGKRAKIVLDASERWETSAAKHPKRALCVRTRIQPHDPSRDAASSRTRTRTHARALAARSGRDTTEI